MRAIIIGAGRGSRLMPTTADTPKCFAEVAGQRMLDWAVDAFRQNGVTDIAFIGGYRIETVQEAHPEFTFRHNVDWPNNNILASLMYAEDLMDEPFMCCYSDVLFTPAIVDGMLRNTDDIALGRRHGMADAIRTSNRTPQRRRRKSNRRGRRGHSAPP